MVSDWISATTHSAELVAAYKLSNVGPSSSPTYRPGPTNYIPPSAVNTMWHRTETGSAPAKAILRFTL